MNYISVLDFETGKVYQYKQMEEEGWNIEEERIKAFLNSVGHNLSNCGWMVHEDGLVVKREGEWWT